jgi:hypothetical protein
MRTAASRTSLLGWSCIGLGLFMAGTPFVSPLVGTPFDGLPALAWSTDRAVLHVLPGLLSVILGVALLSGRTRIEGRWRWALIGTLVALGAWDGLGPWLYDATVPQAGQSGLMFLTIPHYEGWSSLHRFLIKAFCHWLPGMVTVALAGAYVSHSLTTRVLRRLGVAPVVVASGRPR